VAEMQITRNVVLPPSELPGGIPMNPQKLGDQEIVYFYSNYRRWILDYADAMINGKGIQECENQEAFIQDAGFAFLAVINGYFDMVGQLCGSDGDAYDCYRQWNPGTKSFQQVAGHKKKNWRLWDNPPDDEDHKPETVRCVWYGLAAVFEEEVMANNWQPKVNLHWAKFCDSYFKHTRNPIAHTTFPRELLITRSATNDIFWFEPIYDREVLAINLVSWYEKIAHHFEKYTFRIRFPKHDSDILLRPRFLTRYEKLAQ
jgi:hypothetical protein